MTVLARTSAASLLLFDFGAGMLSPMGWLHLAIGVLAIPAAVLGMHQQATDQRLPNPKQLIVTPALTMVVLQERRAQRKGDSPS